MKQKQAVVRTSYGHRVASLLMTSVFVFTTVISAVYTYTRTVAPEQAYAATSSNLNFQARIYSSAGNTVPDGYYNIRFNLYNVSSGGSSLWNEEYYDSNGVTAGNDNRVRVVNGFFSANLGSQTAFPNTINWDQEHWLTMNVGGSAQTATPTYDGEMNPRIKLTAVPYAFRAGQADNVLSSNTSTASTNSAGITIQSGNATGATSNSGSIILDVGTATGTTGTLAIGTANTSGITIGRSAITTILQGSLRFSAFNCSTFTNGGALTTDASGNVSCSNDDGGGASGVTTVGVIDSQSKSANGAVISGVNIYLQTADATYPGLVSTGSQTFAGDKIFNGTLTTGTTSALGTLSLFDGNSNKTTLQPGNSVADLTFILPTTVGGANECLKNTGTAGTLTFANCNNGSGAGGAITLQDAYNAGNTIATTNTRDISFTLADTATDSNFILNVASGATGQFKIQNNGTDTLTISGAGAVASASTITGTTLNGTTGINTGAGAGTNRIDASGNLVNIGNITATAGTTISTGSNGNIVLNANGTGILDVQDAATFAGTLTVTGSQFTNQGSSLYTAAAIANLATGGAIGTAAATVDVDTTFSVNQTTAGQTLSLPSPTTTTAGRIAYVVNVGTASFIMHGVTVATGTAQQYIWSGTAWTAANIDGSGGGPATTLQSAYDAGNTITSTNARNLSVTLADTATDANFIVNVATSSTGTFKVQNNGTDVLSIGSAGQLQLSTSGGTGGILLGGDAALYRSAADYLRTTATFDILQTNASAFAVREATGGVASFLVNTTANAVSVNNGAEFTGWSGDFGAVTFNLFASNGSAQLGSSVTTSGVLNIGTNTTTTAGGIYFGTDTNLYRSGVATLSTNAGTILGTATTQNLFDTVATTLNIGGAASTFNIGPTGATATSINLAGGSGATGCTLAGATGNLVCSGNIAGNSTGTVGYWSRSGTTVQTATAGDTIQTSGNLKLTSDAGTSTSGILFGSTGDVALYRSAADTLKTDDRLLVQTATNTTTAFQVMNSGGTSLIQADTTNDVVGIGSLGADSTKKLLVSSSLVNLRLNQTSTNNMLELAKSGTLLGSVDQNANYLAGGVATGTTATTSGTGSNTTTVTLTGSAFANNDVIFIDNVGQDYYTRITAGGGTASLTVSPAVTFETARTVTKYTIQNIGASLTDYTTQGNRFFQGYFLGGIVAGAGSTIYGDSSITMQGDTNLYRSAADTLMTDDSFSVGTNLSVTGTSQFTGNVGIGASPGANTKLYVQNHSAVAGTYREVSSASGWQTGTNATYSGVTGFSGIATQAAYGAGGAEGFGVIGIGQTTADSQIQGAIGVQGKIRTHDASDYGYSFMAVQDSASTGGTAYGLYINMTDTDTTRYGVYQNSANPNYFAGNIGIGTSTTTNGQLNLAASTSNTGGIAFGTDTNLYRSAANVLTIDDSFQVLGSQFTNQGSTLNTAASLGNFATGGAIGTAAATVDVDTSFGIAQTTAGQTLSLPNPTITTAGRIAYVLNTGSVSFTMHGVTIPAGYGQIYIWNGTAWILGASGGGSAITLQAAYDGGNTITSTNARNLSVTLADTATDANFVINVATSSTGALKVQNNGTDVLSIGSAGQLALATQGSTGGLLIGGDAALYRQGADYLRTTANLDILQTNASAFAVREATGGVASFLVNTTSNTVNINNGADLTGYSGDFGSQTFNLDAANGSAQLGSSVTTSGVLNIGTNTTTAAGGIYLGTDTTLYRSAADTLRTDDDFVAARFFQTGSATSTTALNIKVTGDTTCRFCVNSDGFINWGNGTTLDTTLYRSAANTLATDDSFSLLGTGSNLTVQGTGTSTFAGSLTVNGGQFTNQGSTLNTALGLGDFPTGGSIGSAATTVDIKTTIAVAQTTAGQTLSLSNPTTATAGRVVYVLNTGSASFTMHGVTIPAGYGQIYIWNGTTWILGASGGGSAITLQSAYDGGNTITSSNARNLSVTLADTVTDANFILNVATGSTSELKVQSNGTDVLQIGAAGQLQLDVQGIAGGILIGTDTNLYRSAANTLKTDDELQGANRIVAQSGTAGAVYVGNSSTTAIIELGSSGDTNLYRDGVNILRTDSLFRSSSAIVANYGFANEIITLGTDGKILFAADTNLYRSAADTLQSDSNFVVQQSGDAVESSVNINVGTTAASTANAGLRLRENGGAGTYNNGFNLQYDSGNNIFELQAVNGGTASDVFTVDRTSGIAAFRAFQNNTRAFTVQETAGNDLFTVDNSSSLQARAYIGGANLTNGSQLQFKDSTDTTYVIKSGDGTYLGGEKGLTFATAFGATGDVFALRQTDGGGIFKPTATSSSAFQIQNTAGEHILILNNNQTSILTNPGVDTALTGWTAKGASTVTRTTTAGQYRHGSAGISVVTTAAANVGVSYAQTLLPSTQYTLSYHVKATGANITTLAIGRQDVSGTDVDCAAAPTVFTGRWTRIECTFTTGATITSSNIYLKQTDATARTFYVDSVQLEIAATDTSYKTGTVGIMTHLGIGIANPEEELHVIGDVLLENDEYIKFKDNTGTARNVLAYSTANNLTLTQQNSTSGSIQIENQNNAGSIQLRTGTGSTLQLNVGTSDIDAYLNITANNVATVTSGSTSGTGTNTTTVTLTAAGAFANNDVIFIDNIGQDYYTRIVSGGGTTTLTVSPAVTFETGRTVTKYTIQNIGASTTSYTTQTDRFFQGYFLGGIVAGAGSTIYGDSSITMQGDTNLYRSAADTLKTDDQIRAVNGFYVDTASTNAAFRGSQSSGRVFLQNELNFGEANSAFRVMGDGLIEWGAGGASALDTNLYRSAADMLKTDDNLIVGTNNPVSTARLSAVQGGNGIEFGHSNVAGYRSVLGANAGDGKPFLAFNAEAGTTNNTFRTRGVAAAIIQSDIAGGLVFGNLGSGNADNQTLVNMATLNSVGTFTATGNVIAANGSQIGNHATYGSAYASFYKTGSDYSVLTEGTNTFINAPAANGDILFRTANADKVRIVGSTGYIGVGDASPSAKLSLGGTGVANGISLGDDAAGAVNLYRSGSDMLQTDDTLVVLSGAEQVYIGSTAVGSAPTSGISFGSGQDTNLYRSAANTLKTDDSFIVQTFTNSTTGFQIQNASGTSLFTADTSNMLLTTGGNVRIGKIADTVGAFSKITQTTAGTIAASGTAAIDGTFSSVVYNGSLYVGTVELNSAEVYRFDGGTTWTKVSQATAGTIASGGTAGIDSIRTMIVYNGSLYVGTVETGGAEIYRYDGGTTWTKISQTTAGTVAAAGTAAIDGVTALAVYGGSLYAGTFKANAAEVYRYDGGTTWTRVSSATPGTLRGGGTASIDAVLSMTVFDNRLLIGTSEAANAEIYVYVAGTFSMETLANASGQLVSGGTTAIDEIRNMTSYNGSLYIGTNKPGAGEVYRMNTITYPGSFSKVSQTTAGTIAASGTAAIDQVFSSAVVNGSLYFGTAKVNGAEVYRYDGGTTFTKVSQATAGTISSGGTASYDSIRTMISYNQTLYVGAYDTAGTAEVYSFTASEGASYQLQFAGASDDAGATEQSGFPNYGSISFMSELQGSNSSGNGATGSFLFSHGILSNTGAYDIAEDYPTRDDSLQQGDLIAVDPGEAGFVKKATDLTRETIIGIYSTNPALRLSQKDASISGGRAVPVALAGRVPVRVSTENGVIKPGDALTTSSVPGVAAKALGSGRVVGIALEAYTSDATGTVLVFVNPSFYSPSTAQLVQDGGDATLGNLQVTGNANFASVNVSGQTTLTNLTVTGDATIQGKLTVASIEVGTIKVNGHIVTAGDAPLGEVLGASGAGATYVIDGNDTAGTITISTGSTSVTAGDLVKITFRAPFGKAPKIILSAQNQTSMNTGIFPSSKTINDYILRTDQVLAPNTTYTFDYFIVE